MNQKYYFSDDATILWSSGSWVVSNPTFNSQFNIDSTLLEVMYLLPKQGIPMTRERIIANLLCHGLTGMECENAFNALHACNVLVAIASEAEMGDVSEMPTRQFVVARRAIPYADYSDQSTLAFDQKLMHDFASISPPPQLAKSLAEVNTICLAHPACSSPTTSSTRFAHLLFWIAGSLRTAHFFDHPVLLKCVPSKGARHPFDFYALLGKKFAEIPGSYLYDPIRHRLVLIHEQANITSSCCRLVMTVVFERVQWRYRHSSAYIDIFFDLGHVLATVDWVANELGFMVSRENAPLEIKIGKQLNEEQICVLNFEGV